MLYMNVPNILITVSFFTGYSKKNCSKFVKTPLVQKKYFSLNMSTIQVDWCPDNLDGFLNFNSASGNQFNKSNKSLVIEFV